MQAIAKEFGLPETVFVLPAERPNQTARIRIFTPGRELDFAGHPTVGTAVLLASRRFPELEKAIDAMIVLEENVGPVRCGVKLDPEGPDYAEFAVPRLPAQFETLFGDRGTIADAIGLTSADIGFENHRPSAWTCGSPFIFVPVAGLPAISKIKPVLDRWPEAFGKHDRVGIFAYTRDCVHHDSHFHARMFAPESGIKEDPATGSAAAAFGGAHVFFDALTDGTHDCRIEQGIEMGRPSFIDLSIDVANGQLKSERIGGFAVEIASGMLNV